MSAPRPLGRMLTAATVGALAGAGAYRVLRASPPGGEERWTRTNYRAAPVTLLGGPALVVGLTTGAAASGGGAAAAAVLAGVGAGAFGLVDDLTGSTHARGFRGHLRALRAGEVTSGLVKLAGIGATGLLAGRLLDRRPGEVVLVGALVAGTANLVNLLDLRPGRALKASVLVSLPVLAQGGAGAPLAAAVTGSALALLPADLGERAMVGDAGANAAGAVLAVAVAASAGRTARLGALTVVLALTAASERVSFTAVIDRTPLLRRLDRLGRRPAPSS